MPQANDNHITPTRRQRIEETIERLISVLDAADAPAEDLEPIGDEADTGWPERHGSGAPYCTAAASEDDEPDLGWTGDIDQTRAHRHYMRCQEIGHAETEHDGREPDSDNEPSLGWAIGMGHGNTSDLEVTTVTP